MPLASCPNLTALDKEEEEEEEENSSVETPGFKDNYVQLLAEQVAKFLEDPSSRRDRVTLTGYVVTGKEGQGEARKLLETTLEKLQPRLVNSEQRGEYKREEFETSIPGVKIAKETEARGGQDYTQYILFEGNF